MESPDPLFNAKGHAHSQAKDPATARSGERLAGNPGRGEGRRGGRGRAWGREPGTGDIILYTFKFLRMFPCSRALVLSTPITKTAGNKKKMQKKVMFQGSRPKLSKIYTSFFEIICELPAWCIFLLKRQNSLYEKLKNVF